MKTKEQILKEATKRTLNINEGSPLHDAVMKAMEEYAKQQVKNCSIPAVIKSVCDHNWKEWEDENCNAQMRCTRCKTVKQNVL